MAEEAGNSMGTDGGTVDATGVDAPDAVDVAGKAETRTFTQEDVDRIVRERVARAKTTPPADYEDLKAAAARLAEIEEASKTQAEKDREAREAAERDRDAALERANQRLIHAEVLAEATRQKAMKPEHLHRLIDTEAVTVGDDGQVTGASEAVKAFLEANPEYVGGRPGGSADQGARGGANQVTEAELKSMPWQEVEKARKEGRLKALLGSK